MKLSSLFFLLVALCAAATAQSPAETRAREVAQILDSGDRTAIKKYVTENFGGRMAEIPMDAHLNFFLGEQDQSRGIEQTEIIREKLRC